MSNLPALGAGAAIGAGLSRLGDRPGTLPGLGEGGPRPGQLPAERTPAERREALHDRLTGEGRPDQLPAERREGLRDRVTEGRPDQLPARDWNQRRQDWQQNRDEIREDWSDHRDEARDDWQNWSDDHYGRYGSWYAGHAPGYWGRWDYLWDSYPVAAAAGLTWWGANSIGYQFGYSDYYNPYYVESMPVSYAEPILTVLVEPAQEPLAAPPSSTPASAAPPGAPPEALTKFDEARAAFYEGRYPEALKLVDAAVAQMPRDAVLHEFRALVLFALQRYPESAAAIHAVLDVGPGWDWKTLSSLYPNVDVYTKQLRALETARDKDPKAADLRFLLGYHYLACGQPEAALRAFQRAAELQPKDAVAAALVATLSPREAQPSKPAAAAPPAVLADKLVGAWTASGPRTARYAMNLAKDGTFTWSFSRGSRKEQAKGVYTLEGNVLAMEPDGGGVLLTELTAKGPDSLHFKMIGGAANDAGLEFGRKPSP